MRGTGGALAQKGGGVLLLVSAASRGFCREAKEGEGRRRKKRVVAPKRESLSKSAETREAETSTVSRA